MFENEIKKLISIKQQQKKQEKKWGETVKEVATKCIKTAT